jgi:hypothetical protein
MDDRFGRSVGISGDTVIVGAFQTDDNGSNSGSAYIFTRSGTIWTQQTELTASDGATDDQLGWGVAIDGDTAIVGALLDDAIGNNSGSAYVFTRSGTNWTEFRKMLVSDGADDDQFGAAVAINGTTVIGGGRNRDIPIPISNPDKSPNLAGADQGAAFFFNLLAPTAASATISGRVFSANGQGLRRAIVYMTDQNGNTRTVLTNQFGYYRLAEVEVGQTLILNVYHKQFQFDPQVVNFNDSLNNLNFSPQGSVFR